MQTFEVRLEGNRVALVDCRPIKRPSGPRARRWLLLGPLPPSGLRPTLAAGDVDATGSVTVTFGVCDVPVLDALREAIAVEVGS